MPVHLTSITDPRSRSPTMTSPSFRLMSVIVNPTGTWLPSTLPVAYGRDFPVAVIFPTSVPAFTDLSPLPSAVTDAAFIVTPVRFTILSCDARNSIWSLRPSEMVFRTGENPPVPNSRRSGTAASYLLGSSPPSPLVDVGRPVLASLEVRPARPPASHPLLGALRLGGFHAPGLSPQ